ncbi:DUF6455 family protein [Phaeobacter marinintestinus]|uniref:DUF6455 family protein n=1 Tax=Falsiphaeobacter marinintestinus TaxID=1492905 RepID=UPI0011B5148A|nr:DUF6455 family protein [Phaeobacter marinintestinus]
MDGQEQGEFQRHFWLTRSVARVMGINFTEAMAEGQLTDGEFTDLVSNCRASGCSGFCEIWLSAQTDTPDAAPVHCPNASALNRLQRLYRPA